MLPMLIIRGIKLSPLQESILYSTYSSDTCILYHKITSSLHGLVVKELEQVVPVYSPEVVIEEA